jgi:outer membrane murein-binding lipoprotein Lpp
MKTFRNMTLAAWILSIWALSGCSKAPTSEIEATQKSVEATRAAGSTDYLPAEDKALSDKLNAAMQEIKTQDEKMAPFRNYEQAQKMLADVRQQSEQLKTASAQKKEEAKQQAGALQSEASQAVQKAKDLLAQAPRGKGSEADLAALNADVDALNESLPTVQQAIDKGDYRDAISKATPIKEKANTISAEVEQAIEKVKAADAEKAKSKKGKKKK